MLKIKEIFVSIQGEGPFAGSSAIFIRLAGCNLKCSFCDEHHAKLYHVMNEHQICKSINNLASKSVNQPEIIIITGGEPFLQDFTSFVSLLYLKYEMHIETNGSLFNPAHVDYYAVLKIIVSPKNEAKVHPELIPYINDLKFIVKKGEHPVLDITHLKSKPIWIQPMDEQDEKKNKENTDWAVQLCMKYNYKLSLQLHKIIGIQ